jgi:hypothetical protein
MWTVYVVIAYFLLAILIPFFWAMAKTWRFARVPRRVTCPATDAPVDIALDHWFAMRKHAQGAYELRVLGCSRWPGSRDCAQGCLDQVPHR